ncbi:MAG TPA: phosphatidate cytidylyltransferase [Steroidobacteraceae bacterium]|nr:phosphatidate cytidylyltransferase [Steroidobacteraceae bacterium]
MTESLRKRIMTAAVLVAVLLVTVLYLPSWVTLAVVSLVVLLGAWEWSGFLRLPVPGLRAAYVGLIAVLMFAAWSATVTARGRTLLMGVALLWWCVALLWVMLAPRRVATWSAAGAGVLALVPAWLALVRLRVDLAAGAQWLLYALILVWVADIGAFFSGRRFGRVSLAPRVSPGKTWEGVFGAMLLGGVWALAGALWFHLPALVFLPLCLAVVGFSIVGDLTESLLKRYAGLKDSGSVLPGHGGVMDRIDSITAAVPVLFIGLTLLGVTP